MNEPIDRREYRSRCKHFLPCSDGKCQRIRRYDKKYGINTED